MNGSSGFVPPNFTSGMVTPATEKRFWSGNECSRYRSTTNLTVLTKEKCVPIAKYCRYRCITSSGAGNQAVEHGRL